MISTEHVETIVTGASPDVKALTEALSAPFAAKDVHFKPGKISGNRALALAYVDARAIQDRLDQVLGVLGWQDEYECLPDGSVVCRLRVRLGNDWITKMDVGAPSEQPDEGDRRKAAFSDALKRAAVKFGIGRYLYRLEALWVDYDPQRRAFVKPPLLPAAMVAAATRSSPEDLGKSRIEVRGSRKRDPRSSEKKTGLPGHGGELQQRLNAYDAQLSSQGLCRPGELVKHVLQAGVKAGFEPDLTAWSGPAILLAVEETKAFEGRLRQQHQQKKEVA